MPRSIKRVRPGDVKMESSESEEDVEDHPEAYDLLTAALPYDLTGKSIVAFIDHIKNFDPLNMR